MTQELPPNKKKAEAIVGGWIYRQTMRPLLRKRQWGLEFWRAGKTTPAKRAWLLAGVNPSSFLLSTPRGRIVAPISACAKIPALAGMRGQKQPTTELFNTRRTRREAGQNSGPRPQTNGAGNDARPVSDADERCVPSSEPKNVSKSDLSERNQTLFNYHLTSGQTDRNPARLSRAG